MKKIITIALLSASSMLWAEDLPVPQQGPQIQFGKMSLNESEQKIVLQDFTNNELRVGEQFCWVFTDKPFVDVQIVEQWETPPYTEMENAYSTGTQTNNDGSWHHFSLSGKTNRYGQYHECWAFTRADKVGTYQITLKVNELQSAPFAIKFMH